MNDHDGLVQSVKAIAERLQSLNQRAVLEYAPVVEGILRSHNRDARHIERTLDGLLGFCSDPETLLLYKRLCRHYFAIDPAATAEYIHAYREMWDSEPGAQA